MKHFLLLAFSVCAITAANANEPESPRAASGIGEASGIYLRGGFPETPGWDAIPEYEFKRYADSRYILDLHGKTITAGTLFKVADAVWEDVNYGSDYGGNPTVTPLQMYHMYYNGGNMCFDQDVTDPVFILDKLSMNLTVYDNMYNDVVIWAYNDNTTQIPMTRVSETVSKAEVEGVSSWWQVVLTGDAYTDLYNTGYFAPGQEILALPIGGFDNFAFFPGFKDGKATITYDHANHTISCEGELANGSDDFFIYAKLQHQSEEMKRYDILLRNNDQCNRLVAFNVNFNPDQFVITDTGSGEHIFGAAAEGMELTAENPLTLVRGSEIPFSINSLTSNQGFDFDAKTGVLKIVDMANLSYSVLLASGQKLSMEPAPGSNKHTLTTDKLTTQWFFVSDEYANQIGSPYYFEADIERETTSEYSLFPAMDGTATATLRFDGDKRYVTVEGTVLLTPEQKEVHDLYLVKLEDDYAINPDYKFTREGSVYTLDVTDFMGTFDIQIGETRYKETLYGYETMALFPERVGTPTGHYSAFVNPGDELKGWPIRDNWTEFYVWEPSDLKITVDYKGTNPYVPSIVKFEELGAGVDGVRADSDATAVPVYYNLQGVRVDNPEQGKIYIIRQGSTARKAICN